MHILKINDGKGEFLNSKGEYVNIIDISKEDVYYLSNTILKNDVEIDVEDEEINRILNEAEKIIYENIRIELSKIEKEKATLLSDIETLFNDATEQYKNDLLGKTNITTSNLKEAAVIPKGLEETNVTKIEIAEEIFESVGRN